MSPATTQNAIVPNPTIYNIPPKTVRIEISATSQAGLPTATQQFVGVVSKSSPQFLDTFMGKGKDLTMMTFGGARTIVFDRTTGIPSQLEFNFRHDKMQESIITEGPYVTHQQKDTTDVVYGAIDGLGGGSGSNLHIWIWSPSDGAAPLATSGFTPEGH